MHWARDLAQTSETTEERESEDRVMRSILRSRTLAGAILPECAILRAVVLYSASSHPVGFSRVLAVLLCFSPCDALTDQFQLFLT